MEQISPWILCFLFIINVENHFAPIVYDVNQKIKRVSLINSVVMMEIRAMWFLYTLLTDGGILMKPWDPGWFRDLNIWREYFCALAWDPIGGCSGRTRNMGAREGCISLKLGHIPPSTSPDKWLVLVSIIGLLIGTTSTRNLVACFFCCLVRRIHRSWTYSSMQDFLGGFIAAFIAFRCPVACLSLDYDYHVEIRCN